MYSTRTRTWFDLRTVDKESVSKRKLEDEIEVVGREAKTILRFIILILDLGKFLNIGNYLVDVFAMRFIY